MKELDERDLDERDKRPLAEIRFAQDLPADLQANSERRVRVLLQEVGIVVAQDLIDLGCTGLFQRFPSDEGALNVVRYVRGSMSGSICGLPCYVPRDRYCLVHDTIGGLQAAGNADGPQTVRHPEALPLMSRELTAEERTKVFGVEAKIAEEARKAALFEYGAEDIGGEDPGAVLDATLRALRTCPIPQPPFKCPDHKEPDWECRKCIAQAIVEDHEHVINTTRVYASRGNVLQVRDELQGNLHEALVDLGAGRVASVELWIRVASWSKKVTRD